MVKNRYRIVMANQTHMSAYYFSMPIYVHNSGELVCLTFENEREEYVFKGSDVTVTAKDGL